MLKFLGLAETTPEPLILVTEFVGYLAGWQHGGGLAWVMGLLGAFVALWATCLLWIFACAPYIERITRQPRLKGALSAISAAVSGVILNLAVWFALYVFFARVTLVEAGLLKIWTPKLASLAGRVVLLAALSGFLLLGAALEHCAGIGCRRRDGIQANVQRRRAQPMVVLSSESCANGDLRRRGTYVSPVFSRLVTLRRDVTIRFIAARRYACRRCVTAS